MYECNNSCLDLDPPTIQKWSNMSAFLVYSLLEFERHSNMSLVEGPLPLSWFQDPHIFHSVETHIPPFTRFNLRLERSLLHLWTSIFWKELAVGIYRLLFIRFIYNVQPCFVGPVPMQNKSRQLRTSSWPKSPRTLHPQKKSGGKTPWPVNLSVVRHFSTRNPPVYFQPKHWHIWKPPACCTLTVANSL